MAGGITKLGLINSSCDFDVAYGLAHHYWALNKAILTDRGMFL
jgi:hypothetical protein